MNKFACMALALVAAMAFSPARADMPAERGKMDPQAMEARKAEEALMFKNRREEMLLHISNRISELQEKKNCIQAAGDKESLLKCMPGPPGGGPRGDHMMMRGPDGQPEGHMMMRGPGGQEPSGAPGDDPHGPKP